MAIGTDHRDIGTRLVWRREWGHRRRRGRATPSPHVAFCTSGPGGSLNATYDDAGNLTGLSVTRLGTCLPTGAGCSQRYAYDWDEVGRLVQARRWDSQTAPGAATSALPTTAPNAQLVYVYDANDQRTLKTAVDASDNELYSAYIFDSLELRRATWGSTDYSRTPSTEVGYLFARGVRLARLHYVASGSGTTTPTETGSALHVLLELPDHLGSTSIVLDRDTSELVERGTYMATGQVDSDYRPQRWDSFREDYRFTGKEEDAEVGLAYFGKRYLSPYLDRWLSADPLTVHALQADANAYAYVRGQLLHAVDPTGLAETCDGGGCRSVQAPQDDPSNQSVNTDLAQRSSNNNCDSCSTSASDVEAARQVSRAQVQGSDKPLEAPAVDPVDFAPDLLTGGAAAGTELAVRAGTAGLRVAARGVLKAWGEAGVEATIRSATEAEAKKVAADVASETGHAVANAVAERGAQRTAEGGEAAAQTLYHYTDAAGHTGILESEALNPSLKALNPADARYGNGQYLSDIVPGTKTPAQLSREFLGMPFHGSRFTHYVEIDVSGLNVVQGRPGVFVIPNEVPLDLAGRILSSGRVQ